ncbi:hypothetical protein QUB37_28570 [Microcoleus sp. AT3-A2]
MIANRKKGFHDDSAIELPALQSRVCGYYLKTVLTIVLKCKMCGLICSDRNSDRPAVTSPIPSKAIALRPCSNKLNKSAKFVAQGMQPKAKLI